MVRDVDRAMARVLPCVGMAGRTLLGTWQTIHRQVVTSSIQLAARNHSGTDHITMTDKCRMFDDCRKTTYQVLSRF